MGQFILVILLGGFISGCALGPLLKHETGRTLGKGMNEISLGTIAGDSLGSGFYGFKWRHGISDNFELGVQLESVSFGLKGKYAFINSMEKNGLSSSFAIGAGTSIGGSYYHADLTTSYLFNWFEPYISIRYVKATTEPADFSDSETGDLFLTLPEREYSYGQVYLGSKFWFKKYFAISVEATKFVDIDGTGGISDGVLGSIAFNFIF